jgi:hypothetical protein
MLSVNSYNFGSKNSRELKKESRIRENEKYILILFSTICIGSVKSDGNLYSGTIFRFSLKPDKVVLPQISVQLRQKLLLEIILMHLPECSHWPINWNSKEFVSSYISFVYTLGSSVLSKEIQLHVQIIFKNYVW